MFCSLEGGTRCGGWAWNGQPRFSTGLCCSISEQFCASKSPALWLERHTTDEGHNYRFLFN